MKIAALLCFAVLAPTPAAAFDIWSRPPQSAPAHERPAPFRDEYREQNAPPFRNAPSVKSTPNAQRGSFGNAERSTSLPFGAVAGKTTLREFSSLLTPDFSPLSPGVWLHLRNGLTPAGVLAVSGNPVSGAAYYGRGTPFSLGGIDVRKTGDALILNVGLAPDAEAIWRGYTTSLAQAPTLFGMPRHGNAITLEMAAQSRGWKKTGDGMYAVPGGGTARFTFCPGGSGLRAASIALPDRRAAKSSGVTDSLSGPDFSITTADCENGLCRRYEAKYACRR